MSTELALVDGTQILLEDWPGVRSYELAARIDGALAAATDEELGPSLNALYAQALAAVLVDPSLGGLVSAVREGGEEGVAALEVTITHDAYTAASAIFGLHLTLPYTAGVTPQREAILEALQAALAGNLPTAELSIRERVLAAFRGELEAEFGPILRNAPRPLTSDGTPVVILSDGDQHLEVIAPRRIRYTAHAGVEVFVTGTDAAVLDTALQRVVAVVQAAETLGGLAFDVREGMRAETDVLRQEYTGPLLAARLEVELDFCTPPGNPYEVAS